MGDVDTAVVTMKPPVANWSISAIPVASYGYDQRIEVHGSKGMLRAENVTESTVVLSTDAGVRHEKPMFFFLERYAAAYRNEWDGFVRMVLDADTTGIPTALDGLRSLELAEKAVSAAQ